MGCTFSPEERDLIKLEDGRRGRLPTLDCRKKSTKVLDIILENVKLITEELTSEQVDRCMLMLKQHQLFNGLAEQELRAVCEGMVWMEGNKNEYLFQQGETGHSFFLIESGVVGVEVDGIRLGSLNKGQSFGELALLFRASRAASIIC